ncbi:hypothetical protein VUJ46_18835 [Chryseobacterium sp. MYb264]|uniref:hypothetical protein n=1 Tax=Chryseobacterium sp. MYb264 TaxID=2745153 RepID=UPI002E15F36C|nr:hypothetical protein VUJ46_18835 [Chryseobacterium sp. MYb264]
MRKTISVFAFILFFNSYAQNFPNGNYTITTKVEEIGTENIINMKFDFYFDTDKVFLRLDTKNSQEAYCEGEYSLKENKNKILILKYIGEGICSSDSIINTIYVKRIKKFYYIKSGRFESNKWLKLEKSK